jgi:hypothetical protein
VVIGKSGELLEACQMVISSQGGKDRCTVQRLGGAEDQASHECPTPFEGDDIVHLQGNLEAQSLKAWRKETLEFLQQLMDAGKFFAPLVA